MTVSERDVRHVAALARIGLDATRVPALVRELNGILGHMEVLRKVHASGDRADGVGAGGMPLRDDGGRQYPLAHAREQFAPEMRAGFYLVPRLATHTALGATAGGTMPDVVADDVVEAELEADA